MKIFVLIFNFYLLILPCLPCADEDDCAKEEKTSIYLHLKKEKENNENHKEKCTPFCHCVCCNSTVLLHTNLEQKFTILHLPTIKFSTVEIKFKSTNFNIIWQPPKFLG